MRRVIQSKFSTGYAYEIGHLTEMQGMVIIDGIMCEVLAEKGQLAKVKLWPDGFVCYVAEYNGVIAHGRDPHNAFQNAENKYYARRSVESRIADCIKLCKEKSGKLPGKEWFKQHGYLTGSCEIGRRQFLKTHPEIDLEKEYTVAEFVDTTKDEYSGDIIKRFYDAWTNRQEEKCGTSTHCVLPLV